MQVMVNGDPRSVPDGASVADVVAQVTQAPRGIAVARNGTVVRRAVWSEEALAEGDAVEILTAVQGG